VTVASLGLTMSTVGAATAPTTTAALDPAEANPTSTSTAAEPDDGEATTTTTGRGGDTTTSTSAAEPTSTSGGGGTTTTTTAASSETTPAEDDGAETTGVTEVSDATTETFEITTSTRRFTQPGGLTPTSAAETSIAVTRTTTQTIVEEASADDRRRVQLVISLLSVVGLLIMLLTWRYWVWTNPRRGYTYSRAKLVVPRGDPALLDDDVEGGYHAANGNGDAPRPGAVNGLEPAHGSPPDRLGTGVVSPQAGADPDPTDPGTPAHQRAGS
jgi:hypothetical protein